MPVVSQNKKQPTRPFHQAGGRQQGNDSSIMMTAAISSVPRLLQQEQQTIPLFGTQSFPTVFLDLEASNRTDTKCVTINGLEFCTTIHSCPEQAYQCNYINDGGHDCGFYNPQCNCSATWGLEDECSCYVGPAGPLYWVSANVQCGDSPLSDENVFLRVDDGDFYCFDSVQDVCVRGQTLFRLYQSDDRDGDIQVQWQCPEDVTAADSHGDCTCKALQSYTECSSCKVCSDDEPGDFEMECPGFSMDCNRTMQLSTWMRSMGSRRSAKLVPAAMFFLSLLWIYSVTARGIRATITRDQIG